MSYVSNNVHSVRTEIGEFLIEQRNAGYEPADGKWVVSQLPELYWSDGGWLRTRRPGKLLGIFADEDEVNAVIAGATRQPVKDEAVRSIGRVSC